MTTTPRPAAAQADDPRLVQAFRDLHGRRLHGFALLVALGEPEPAERAAGEALAAGGQRAAALRHPERAAAWLRARTLRALHQGLSRGSAIPASERMASLAPLGVDPVVYDGLALLTLEGRAALVASAIERFELMDTETILGASPSAARRVVALARTRYLQAVEGRAEAPVGTTAGQAEGELAKGELAKRVREVAARAMTPGWHPD